MKAEYFIELPSDAEGELSIARWSDGKLQKLEGWQNVSGKAAKAVAFAPGLSVSKHSVRVSGQSGDDAARAALFALEDDLAQRVEDVVLALAPDTAADGRRHAYVVDKAVLGAWRTKLQRAGFGGVRIVPETSFVAKHSAWRFSDRVLMIRDGYAAAADASLDASTLRDFMDASGFEGVEPAAADSLEVLAALYATQPGVSLDRPVNEARRGIRAWMAAGALALLALGLWMGTIAFETRNLHSEIRDVQAKAEGLFRKQFPEAPGSADIPAETRRLMQLGGADGGAPFSAAAAALYQAISASPTIQLRALSYTAEAGTLTANLKFANAPDEAAFRSRLETYGLRTISAEVSDLGTGPEGMFVLEPAP